MENSRILLDMDEVLVDFVGGALRAHGISREEYLRRATPGEWGMATQLGLTKEEFWGPILRQREEFWERLGWCPWARKLLDIVKNLTSNWYIVTTPGYYPTAYSGKMRFLGSRSGDFFEGSAYDRVVMIHHKALLARNRQTILVDDREETVQNFRAAGGTGLLFPAFHNSSGKEISTIKTTTGLDVPMSAVIDSWLEQLPKRVEQVMKENSNAC